MALVASSNTVFSVAGKVEEWEIKSDYATAYGAERTCLDRARNPYSKEAWSKSFCRATFPPPERSA